MEINLLESTVKVREGKKWKSRWCVLKKVSPVADCLHLYVYKESSGSKKQPKEKASHVLEDYCGLESGYRVDKEDHVLSILCVKQVLLVAFTHRHTLQEWTTFIRDNLSHESTFQATLIQSPPESHLQQRPVRIFLTSRRLSLVAHIPPVILVSWLFSDIRRYGAVTADTFCVEGGTRAGKGTGLFAFLTDHGKEIEKLVKKCSSSQQHTQTLSRRLTHTGCISSSISPIELAQSRHSVLLTPSPGPLPPHSPVFTFPSPPSSSSPSKHDWHTHKSRKLSSTRKNEAKVQPSADKDGSSVFSSYGDLGVNNSEVKRCLESRSRLSSFGGDPVQRSGSADLLDRRCSRSSLDYVNGGFVDNDPPLLERSLNRSGLPEGFSSPNRVSANNLPIIHGHSRSVGCDGSENFMDFSDILKSKAKDSRKRRQNSVSSSTCASQNRLDKASTNPSSSQVSQRSTDSIDSHAYANSVFINQVSRGSHDLLSEILSECQFQDSQFHHSPLGASSGNNKGSGNPESHVSVSQSHYSSQTKDIRVSPPLLKPIKPSVKDHSYVNYQPGQPLYDKEVNTKTLDQKSFPLLHNLLKGFTGPVTQTQPDTGIENSKVSHVTEYSTNQTKASDEEIKSIDFVKQKIEPQKLQVSNFRGHVSESSANQATDLNTYIQQDHNNQGLVGHNTKRRSASLPDLFLLDSRHVVRDCQDEPLEKVNSVTMTQRGGDGNNGEQHKGSSQNKKKSHQQKKRQSRSLPEFDPLRPLEFVDLSKYDGKDEGYLYWLKAEPNPETRSDQPTRGYDNVTQSNAEDASYINVDMKTLKQLGQAPGYDNVPKPNGNQRKNYDNLVGDNRTDFAKATVDYENFPQAKAQTVASSNYYQNLPSKTCVMPTGANTYSSSKSSVCDVRSKQFYANIPPEGAEKPTKGDSKKKAGKKKKGSHLPFGGTFAIHGSLRRSKPTQKSAENLDTSVAGDIAGSYVKLKGNAEEGEGGIPGNMGVMNLAHAVNRFEGVSENGIINDDNVELVILDMSDDDPQRDNIANMLVEQGRPLPRGRPLYGRTGPPQPLPPRRFSIHSVTTSSSNTPQHNCTDSQTSPRVNHSTKSQNLSSSKSAFQPIDRKSSLSKSRSSSPMILLDRQHIEADTYGAFKDKPEKKSDIKRGRDSEYIDMSQPLRTLPNDAAIPQSSSHTMPLVHASRSRNNSTSSSLSQASSQDQPRDSPYMDMSFMKHKNKSKSPLATPERKKMASPKSSPLLHANRLCLGNNYRENGSATAMIPHRRLQHSKSLDNELDDIYYSSEPNGVSMNGTTETTTNGSSQQYLPMSTINRFLHQQSETSKTVPRNGDCENSKMIRRSQSENDQDKPLKPFDGLLDLPCYTDQKVSSSSKKTIVENVASSAGYSKVSIVEEDAVSTTSSSGSSGTMSRRGSKGFLARLMRKNSSAKDLAKISKSQEDILEVESEAASPSRSSSLAEERKPEVPPREGSAAEHIYAQIPEQMPELYNGRGEDPLRDPVTLPLRKKSFRDTSESFLLDPVVRKEIPMIPHTTAGRVCLEHGNLTDEQKQSCTTLLSGRSMTPPTPPPNIPLPPPPRKLIETLSSTPPPPPIPIKSYRKNKKIPPPLPQQKAEHEYVDIDDDNFPRGTGRETPKQGQLQPFAEQLSQQLQQPHHYPSQMCEKFSHLGFLEDGRPVPPPRPASSLTADSKTLSYEAEDCCNAASRPRQIVQRSVSLRAQPVSRTPPTSQRGATTLPPHHHHDNHPNNNGSSPRYVLNPSSTMLRPRSAREYHHIVDRKRWLGGDECPSSSGASSDSQTPASSSQSSPAKSPGILHNNVFNFDPQNVKNVQKQPQLPHHHQGGATGGSDTDSPLGFRDPDHVYMNLTFPKSPGRSGSPVVVDAQQRAALGHTPDYANVVLNYAEIDLSRSSKDSPAKKKRGADKALQKSNTDYAMIDMVATAAVSRAGKEHIRHREEESLRHQRQQRRNEQGEGKDSQRKGKERKGNQASGGGAGGRSGGDKDKKLLSRSNSSASRGAGNSGDRKSSLPA